MGHSDTDKIPLFQTMLISLAHIFYCRIPKYQNKQLIIDCVYEFDRKKYRLIKI